MNAPRKELQTMTTDSNYLNFQISLSLNNFHKYRWESFSSKKDYFQERVSF